MHAARPGVRLSPVVIGRADLVELAERRWRSAVAGEGQLLLLAGEAGIGKSRLLRELAASVKAGGGAVIIGAAFPADAGATGGALLDLASQARRAQDAAIAQAGQAITARLRDLAESPGDAHHRRRLLVTDLADSMVDIARAAAPPLLCLEDLHWADELTLAVLDRVAQHLHGVRMLVVGSYRSDEPPSAMRGWRARLLNQRRAEELKLARLSRAETARLCAAIAGAAVPAAVVDVVHARSDGIPLHVEELLATVSTSDGDPVAVPETLAEAVLARAAALTPPARALADLAAVIGRSFDLEQLAEQSAVDDSLRELLDQQLIQTGRDAYEFRHALIRDALYADLSPHRRRELHLVVAEAEAARGGDDAMVSAHYERAHRPEEAYRRARTAATQAAALSAHRDAVDLLRRAQRTQPSTTPAAERIGLWSDLAAALAAIDDNAAAAQAYARAYELHQGEGDLGGAAALVPAWVAVRHLLGAGLAERTAQLRDALETVDRGQSTVHSQLEAALSAAYMLSRRLDEAIEHGERAREAAGDSSLFNVDTTLGSVLVFAGRMDEGWRLLEDAVDRAVAARAEAEAARAYRMIGSSSSVLVEYDRAQRWLADGIAYAERTERWNDRHYMAAHLAHVQWATGRWDAADATARQAQADGRGGITTHITALHVLGYLALGRGDQPTAHTCLTEARELGERMGELQRLSPAVWGLAELSVQCGQFAEAVDWCEQGYAASAEVADAAYLFPYVVTGVRARLATDDLSGARGWLERCTRLLIHRHIPGTLPALRHAEGLLELADGHPAKAREALHAAGAEWDRRRRFWEGTQARLDLARCAVRSRRMTEAAGLVAQARAAAVQAGAGPLITAADELTASSASTLSPREIEVARLIAGGATNREIAAALYIAPKTVAAHVEHILTKLGANRRAEIAAWVTRLTETG
jgi:DNA-binding CsgD family transcriptional regulator/tetratricopeptide (TPR) repeat protein